MRRQEALESGTVSDGTVKLRGRVMSSDLSYHLPGRVNRIERMRLGGLFTVWFEVVWTNGAAAWHRGYELSIKRRA